MRTKTVWRFAKDERYATLVRSAHKKHTLHLFRNDATGFLVAHIREHIFRGPVEARRQAAVLWELWLLKEGGM